MHCHDMTEQCAIYFAMSKKKLLHMFKKGCEKLNVANTFSETSDINFDKNQSHARVDTSQICFELI